ncbi:uncharacterized protein I303_106711 [Kwoniella dejecticola CBS 10117]|uniref:Uncharacterized protein n=1 Tax=Kwoniella dejecticola CBS 10117 TaxID=1296121 RepID=A0A1A5ZTX6_9TREE|nr:uncharacterized protein I303_08647 [Kwoniella dejecticola CBS 10117]OBR81261.1 hypothetical protein I303_08647 [Kwoniella dejecticola CBS 10117]
MSEASGKKSNHLDPFTPAAVVTVPAAKALHQAISSINWADKQDQAKEYVQQCGKAAIEYAKEHPYQTAVIIGSGVIVVCPGLVTGPALQIIGLTSEGVRRASLASMIQSGIGNVPAGSLFAIGQSAAAGGAGVTYVNGLAQAATSLSSGSNVIKRCSKTEARAKL